MNEENPMVKNTINKFEPLYRKFMRYTLIPREVFIDNLDLIEKYACVDGIIVECGVYKGGMIAAIAQIFANNRQYHLFDSFEGLPEAQQIDGESAIRWQNDRESKYYFDNCRTDAGIAGEAMKRAGIDDDHFQIHKGWFVDTIPSFKPGQGIAILRLDGDWYDSTKICLDHLFPKVVDGGLVIIDDYYVWDGCAKAVHDFLSEGQLPYRIRQTKGGVCFIEKKAVNPVKSD